MRCCISYNMFSVLLCPCFLCTLSSAAPLLIITLESFRWDYLDLYEKELSALGRLARAGVQAEYLEPDFPTKPFTNDYTITTGLYNEYHGMMSLDMYDPRRNDFFHYETGSYDYRFWWDNADPIWSAAIRQGKRTHLFNWPDCLILGLTKSLYCGDSDFLVGIDRIRSYLKNGLDVLLNSTADLVGIYTEEVDIQASHFGPRSLELGETMLILNDEISFLMSTIESSRKLDELNVLIVSGNGITEVSPQRIIRLNDYVADDGIARYTGEWSVIGVWPLPGKLDQIYHQLRSAHVNMTVYRKEDSPEHWHYRYHDRIAPILVSADRGWILQVNSEPVPDNKTTPVRGFYGYDNMFSDMRGTFIASGPAFKSSYKSKPIKAVDVYQVICKLLDITPSPHNGSWERVRDMFKSNTASSISWSQILMSLLLFLSTLLCNEIDGICTV